MEKKFRIFLVGLLVITNIFAYKFNFWAFYDGKATFNNFLVSILVIFTWVVLALFSRKLKKWLYSISIYWLCIFFTSLVRFIQYCLDWYTPAINGLMVIPIIAFYPPFDGLTYFFSYGQVYLLNIIISSIFLLYCFIANRFYKLKSLN